MKHLMFGPHILRRYSVVKYVINTLVTSHLSVRSLHYSIPKLGFLESHLICINWTNRVYHS